MHPGADGGGRHSVLPLHSQAAHCGWRAAASDCRVGGPRAVRVSQAELVKGTWKTPRGAQAAIRFTRWRGDGAVVHTGSVLLCCPRPCRGGGMVRFLS